MCPQKLSDQDVGWHDGALSTVVVKRLHDNRGHFQIPRTELKSCLVGKNQEMLIEEI